MTNCQCARGGLLVEDLIASTFRFVLQVLIRLEFYFNYDDKAKWAGFYRQIL